MHKTNQQQMLSAISMIIVFKLYTNNCLLAVTFAVIQSKSLITDDVILKCLMLCLQVYR